MIRERIAAGEVAVVGLGRSGAAAARLLARAGARVYASDVKAGDGAPDLPGVEVQRGGHDLERIARAALVVASPGVPVGAPPLAFLPRARVIAVTGTNGKSTVTELAGHLLRALGRDAVAAGNIGYALSEAALREQAPAWIALEMSSFQLRDTPGLRPTVGVLTNLAPDHLDAYASVEEYYADKQQLFRNASAESRWVTNADDAEVQRRTAAVRGTHCRFSLTDRRADAAYRDDALHLAQRVLLPRADLPLLGTHNVANALAAALAVWAADEAHREPAALGAMAAALRSFRGLPHRYELVGEFDGVQWINDSKATNVSSAQAAISSLGRRAVVLLGGRHKGEPYAALVEPLKRHARLVLAYGESAPRIESELAAHVPLERLGSSFPEVIARARQAARPGDAVLLSPACSSYDMFRNFEERGAEFRRLATGR